MSSRPRVAFVGNCQAQTFESMSGHLGLPIEVLSMPPVFDLQAMRRPEVRERLEAADIVFNQRVSATYEIEFIRPDALRTRFGSRAISWPNVYFDGYFPGIEYVYAHAGKVTGPLSEYHLRFVRKAWASGQRVDELLADFLEGPLARDFANAAEHSLDELRERELGLDVRISDEIGHCWRYRKALFSMNHPDDRLLLRLLRRLLSKAGIEVGVDERLLDSFPYTLNEIDIPAFPGVHRAHRLGFAQRETLIGRALDLDRPLPGCSEEKANYDWRSLFDAYYRLYDAVSARSEEDARVLRYLSS